MIPLYNHKGQVVAFANDTCEAIFQPDGTFLAWLEGSLLYSTSGQYLGYVADGWLLDHTGRPALFAPNASGLPHKPRLTGPEPKGPIAPQTAPPRRPRLEARPARRKRIPEWSALSGLAYFKR